MTSSELFLCTPRVALENDSSFVLTLKEQVGESNFASTRVRAWKERARALISMTMSIIVFLLDF